EWRVAAHALHRKVDPLRRALDRALDARMQAPFTFEPVEDALRKIVLGVFEKDLLIADANGGELRHRLARRLRDVDELAVARLADLQELVLHRAALAHRAPDTEQRAAGQRHPVLGRARLAVQTAPATGQPGDARQRRVRGL